MKNIYKIILTGLILGTMLVNSSCSLKGLNNDVETTSTPLPTSTDLNNKTETNNPVQEDDTNNLSVLNHTYTTRYGEVNSVTCPQFAFDYSDNWTVTKEDINVADRIEEWVTLTNNNGVEINYISHSNLGGDRFITKYEVSKAADSQFIPGYAGGEDEDYSVLGNFMVGEIKAIGEYDIKTGDLNPFDGGTSYAVMPESYICEHDAAGLSGFLDEFSFTYASNILFYSEAPNGVFTDSDKQEVIQILSSFRVVE